MPSAVEATAAHPRPEDLREQTAQEKKTRDGHHGPNAMKPTDQTSERMSKPKGEVRVSRQGQNIN